MHVNQAASVFKTSEDGRKFVADYFANVLLRQDFTGYINEHLAADFACALADGLHALQKHCDGFAEQAAFQRDARLGALKELAIVEKQRDELLEALELQERQNELAAKQQWIDPNDKTQPRYLPHIGEPVLFCHQGKTYYGLHTGGSFKAGHGVTAKLFRTWDCMWMPLPEPADTRPDEKGDAK